MKTVCIVQARMGSSRLPGKVLKPFGGAHVLGYLWARLARAEGLDAVCVATSTEAADHPVAEAAGAAGFPCVRGSLDDVLARYLQAANETGAERIVRITADCPFADPQVIDAALALQTQTGADYCSNVIQRTYPDGLDVEVFTRAALERAAAECADPRMREHVTPYMRTRRYPDRKTGEFALAHLTAPVDFSHLRWTLDTPEDLDFLRQAADALPADFGWMDLVALLTRRPDLLMWNRSKRFRVGALAPSPAHRGAGEAPRSFEESNALFDRVVSRIPLASQTFSKSYFQGVRGAAPLFIDHAYGSRCWDVDGNGYIDYVMGLLPVVLGHCDPDVDAAIVRQLEQGQIFSMPSVLEGQLAEELASLIPSAEMVRYGKNGSDATSAAIRIARAATGRERVIAAGYHGWHDWYIGATERRLGVPEAVQDLTRKVPFNDLNALEDALKRDRPAAFILEPCGATEPAEGYLEGVRALTERYGTVLIFDEIISGFRVDLGGAQSHYGVTPDLSTFGKSIANGMPLSAVVGRRDLMLYMEDIFFSGTFGGETVSLAAALATIEKLKRENVVSRIRETGRLLIDRLNGAIREAAFDETLSFGGPDWWPRLQIANEPTDPLLFKSLLRQNLHGAGLLLSSSLNLSHAHCTAAVIEETEAGFAAALGDLRANLQTGNPAERLRGEPLQAVFAVR